MAAQQIGEIKAPRKKKKKRKTPKLGLTKTRLLRGNDLFSLKVQTRVGQVSSRRIAARRSPRTAKSADYGEEKKIQQGKKKENMPFQLSSPERRARSEACGGGQAGREDAASPEPWGRRRGCVGSCCPALTGSGSCSRRASGRRQPGGLSLHPLLLGALLGPHGAGGGKIPAQRVQGDS